MKEANDKKESMKPVSQAVVELDDEALDQVSGGLKRLDSDWKPEITEVCKLSLIHIFRFRDAWTTGKYDFSPVFSLQRYFPPGSGEGAYDEGKPLHGFSC